VTQLINIKSEHETTKEKGLFFCRELEKGNILFFLKAPFALQQSEIDFLSQQRAKCSAIVYAPQTGSFRHPATKNPETIDRIRAILAGYSDRATAFLSELLSPCSARWKLECARFLLGKETTKGDTALQVDALSRPTHGSRILRFFTNLHATEGKRWVTSKSFSELLQAAGDALPFPKSCTHSLGQRLTRKVKGLLASGGVKIALRSPYDQFMARLQRFLQKDQEFQQQGPKSYWDFPPGSCWAFFTDQISHTPLSTGQVLELVFTIPNEVLLFPDQSPISILERLTGRNMVDPELRDY